MKYRPSILILILLVLVVSCEKKMSLEGFDQQAWKSDFNGCKGIRLNIVEQLEDNLDKLKGLSQKEIVSILGKPEANELYKRSQKFFIYNITPVKSCVGTIVEEQLTLNIRFNAMGLAKEVLIYSD